MSRSTDPCGLVGRRRVEVPETVPAEVARAVRDTLGGRHRDRRPASGGSALTAREAFTDGLQTAAGINAITLAAVAATAAVVLRPVAT